MFYDSLLGTREKQFKSVMSNEKCNDSKSQEPLEKRERSTSRQSLDAIQKLLGPRNPSAAFAKPVVH